jgi:hypothetical protein
MNHNTNCLYTVIVCWCGRSSRPGTFTYRHCALFKAVKPLIALRLAHSVLPICLVKQLKCLCKIFTQFVAKFHTHTRSSSSLIVTSLVWRTACACAQFSRCSSMTNIYSEMGQMAVCCQNLMLGALISCSALSVLVGMPFKKFSLFLNMPCVYVCVYIYIYTYIYMYIYLIIK